VLLKHAAAAAAAVGGVGGVVAGLVRLKAAAGFCLGPDRLWWSGRL